MNILNLFRKSSTEWKLMVLSHRYWFLCFKVENVKNIQEALREALSELEKAKSPDEVRFLENQVGELKKQSDQMVLVLKVCKFTLYIEKFDIHF